MRTPREAKRRLEESCSTGQNIMHITAGMCVPVTCQSPQASRSKQTEDGAHCPLLRHLTDGQCKTGDTSAHVQNIACSAPHVHVPRLQLTAAPRPSFLEPPLTSSMSAGCRLRTSCAAAFGPRTECPEVTAAVSEVSPPIHSSRTMKTVDPELVHQHQRPIRHSTAQCRPNSLRPNSSRILGCSHCFPARRPPPVLQP